MNLSVLIGGTLRDVIYELLRSATHKTIMFKVMKFLLSSFDFVELKVSFHDVLEAFIYFFYEKLLARS